MSVFFLSKKSLGAGGDQRELSTGGAGAAGSRAGFCPHLMEAVCRSFVFASQKGNLKAGG